MKIRGNVSADTIDDYRQCQTRYSFLHPTQINCRYMDVVLRVAANAASVEGDSY